MSTPSIFLVAGGTGRQGGAVVNALLSDSASPVKPNNIYVLTRNASGAAAEKLVKRGINIIVGDLKDPCSILADLKSSIHDLSQVGTFLAQAHGPSEVGDAKGLIDAAAASGIPYFVYSSVDRGGKELSDRDASYCKTFSDKFLIEKHLISVSERSKKEHGQDQGMDYTILRPVWFVENTKWGFPGRLCMTGWRDTMKGKRLQVITAADLGKWAVEALTRPDETSIRNDAISVASDELTFDELNKIYTEETGSPVEVTYWWLAGIMIWLVKDLNTMFGFIGERGYGADIEWLKEAVEPTTFRSWARSTVQ